jgi:hypothetical protein
VLLRLFRSGQPFLLLVIPLLAVLMWMKYLLLPQPVHMSFEPNPMPLYQLFNHLLEGKEILGKIVTLSLLLFIAFWLSKINTRFIILQHRTYLIAVIYLLIVSSYLPLQQLNPAVFATVLLVFSIQIMLDSYRKEGLALGFYLAAFLVSIASLFYARAALLMFVVWTGLSLFRTFHWREWAFTFFGFATPVFFLFSYYYLMGQDLAENWESIRYNFVHDRGMDYINTWYIVFYSYLFFTILVASRKMIRSYQILKIYIRKFYRLNFWIFIFVMAVFLSIYSRAPEMIYFSSIPVAYILAFLFFNTRSRLAGEILFGLLFAGFALLLYLN